MVLRPQTRRNRSMPQLRRHLARRRRVLPGIRGNSQFPGRSTGLGLRHGRSRKIRSSAIVHRRTSNTLSSKEGLWAMFEWVFDLPTLVTGPGIVAALLLFYFVGSPD